jgi:predicted AAA+ superfamily ATPase
MIDLNPWWKEPFSLEYHEREIYPHLQKFMPLPQIIAMTGLRRVGKTTLMHKIVYDTINNGFDPSNILFFSFDEFKNINIRDLLREYEKSMEKDFKKNNYLLLLDEIQKLKSW